jgi:hypothetical protein
VKADEAAAAAEEAADEQRMQELDAERRAAILRGLTPPPLPTEEPIDKKGSGRAGKSRDGGHDRKRRKLTGEDETDMEIRLAQKTTGPKEDEHVAVLKLRKPTNDAPLEDHAGNINLFPVDHKEAMKREKNAEAEKEKKKKQQAFEDQYTMRLSNAAGKGGLESPWYAAAKAPREDVDDGTKLIGYPGFMDKDVWGNEDPRRKEREQNRIVSNDPFAFMQKAQAQLKRSKEDKKKWAKEREQELMDLRATQEREWRRDRHSKRKRQTGHDDLESFSLDVKNHERDRSSKHQHRHKSRSHSRERKPSYRHERKRSRSRSRERDHDRESNRKSSRHERESRDHEQLSQRASGRHDDGWRTNR